MDLAPSGKVSNSFSAEVIHETGRVFRVSAIRYRIPTHISYVVTFDDTCQGYNIGQSRTTRPVIVTPRQAFGSTTNGHDALQGSANFRYYMNPSAFRLPQGFEIGDVPSAFPNWRGPGFSQWDLSVLKDFPLHSEARRLQLRFEAQNLLNHMNSANPNGAVTQRTFGMITGQLGSPRRVMIAAKIYF